MRRKLRRPGCSAISPGVAVRAPARPPRQPNSDKRRSRQAAPFRHLALTSAAPSGSEPVIGWLHCYQVDAEVAQPVKQPVQVRLVTDLPDEHGLVLPGFEHHPVEGGLETLSQPPAQDYAVPAAGHGSALSPGVRSTAAIASGGVRGARRRAWVIAQAALTSPMWLNACGKLPIVLPLRASNSSTSRPTSLIAATARSNVAVA